MYREKISQRFLFIFWMVIVVLHIMYREKNITKNFIYFLDGDSSIVYHSIARNHREFNLVDMDNT